jgi:hypothetical protein
MIRWFVLLLACSFATGCFVFDELDKGAKIMDQHTPKKAAEAPPAQKAPAQTGSGWWANAKPLSGPPSDADGKNPAVACKVSGSTRFMRKADCLSQGGQPAS